MYAHREKQAVGASGSTAAAADPGRESLAEQLADEEHDAQRRPSGIQWPTTPAALARSIQEPPLPREASAREDEHEEGEHTLARAAQAPGQPAPQPPPPADATPVSHGDDPAALERIYGDAHHNAHGAPFEEKHAHAEKHRPKQDAYNRKGVKSDKETTNTAGRPGAITHDKHGKADGVFELEVDKATRYLYVRHGNDNVAEPYDVVERKDLAPHNFRAQGKDKDSKGHQKRLLLNPSQPRKLLIGGKQVMCVLSWIDGMTAAWIPLDDLKGDKKDHDHLLHSVQARAKKWDPAKVSEDPSKILSQSQRYVIRNDEVGESTPADEGKHGKSGRVLAAGQKNGDNVVHYLTKDVRKPGFDEAGKPLGKNVTRSVVSICMNLPEPHVPPVAIDTAEAGQSFFVMRATKFHRRVPVFENGAHKSDLLQTWVFGHLAMRDAAGNLVPDPNRRGWVPLRVLAEADHLTMRDIPQRKD